MNFQATTAIGLCSQHEKATLPHTSKQVLLWHWGRIGSGATFTFELARELGKLADIKLTVSASEGSELASLTESEKSLNLRTVRTFEGNKTTWRGKLNAALALFSMPRLASDFREIHCEGSTDVAICTFQSIWDLAAIPTLRRRESRFILILHDAEFHPGDSYPLRQKILGWEVAAADALIVLSDHVAQAAKRLYRFQADRIWNVPLGVSSFGSDDPAPRAFPSNRPVRLLFFGRIVKYKGIGQLLDAYQILRKNGHPVELDLVGSGDLAPYSSQLASLPDISIINTWVDDDQIARTLTRADIVLLPYIEASQSGVAAAALTAGLPIVATPVGGLVEQVQHCQTGIIAKSIAPADIAAAIECLIKDPHLYEACSAGALRHARENLGWAQIADRIAGIVNEVAQRPKRCEQK